MDGHNREPIGPGWIAACGEMKNDLLRVVPVAINSWYDGIEVWNRTEEEDGIEPDGVLVLHRFPITKGDVRCLCAALEVPCLA